MRFGLSAADDLKDDYEEKEEERDSDAERYMIHCFVGILG
jgi:hypothetical protein